MIALMNMAYTRNDTLGCPDFDYMAGQIWMMILIMMQVNGLIVTQMDLAITSLDFRAMHAPMIMEKVGWMFLVAKTQIMTDEGDAFPYESTQWSDRDFDGYGANLKAQT